MTSALHFARYKRICELTVEHIENGEHHHANVSRILLGVQREIEQIFSLNMITRSQYDRLYEILDRCTASPESRESVQ